MLLSCSRQGNVISYFVLLAGGAPVVLELVSSLFSPLFTRGRFISRLYVNTWKWLLIEKTAGLTTCMPVRLERWRKINGLRRLMSDLLLRSVPGESESRPAVPVPAGHACSAALPLLAYRGAGLHCTGTAGLVQQGCSVCSAVRLKVGAVVHTRLLHLLHRLLWPGSGITVCQGNALRAAFCTHVSERLYVASPCVYIHTKTAASIYKPREAWLTAPLPRALADCGAVADWRGRSNLHKQQ